MDELKPCPFCGGAAQLRVFGWIDHKEHYGIRCLSCFAQTMDFYETKTEAIEAWNTRHERTVKLEESDRCPDCKKLVGTGENYCAWCGAKVVD